MTQTSPSAKFGVSIVQGQDEFKGDVFYVVGILESGILREELAAVLARNVLENVEKDPDFCKRKLKQAKLVADALNEYADNHNLPPDSFFI